MTASDHLKHRTGSIGGDQIQRYFAEHTVVDGDDYKLVRSMLSADENGNLVLYSDFQAALAQKTRECEDAKHEKTIAESKLGILQEIESGLRAQVEQLGRQVAELQDANEEANARLHRIDDWCKAYPLDVFPEPDLEADRRLLGDSEFTRLNAHSMRHVVNGIAKIASRARTK